MAAPSLEQLRRYAIGRSLFKPTTLIRAIGKLGFVQADPIRAPARAQDLTLRHRVKDYRAGDLERAYPRLALEEDFFINYGFLRRDIDLLMHPYTPVVKRKLGYYALPLLWRDEIVAWANLTMKRGELDCQLGFLHGRPSDPEFDRELEAELERMRGFLRGRERAQR